jgi:excisionase family DNA binding protein
MMATEQMLTPKEVMQRLRISRNTFYRWVHDRGLPARKVGRVWRVPADELDEWERRGGAES